MPYDKAAVEAWYYERTIQIENSTGLVDVALTFAELAIANGCTNMSALVEDLRTLYTLTYECTRSVPSTPTTASATSTATSGSDDRDGRDDTDTGTFYTLAFVSQLSELEKLSLIMSHSYDTRSDMYERNVREWLMPFVERRATIEKREALLRAYLASKARDADLHPCLRMLRVRDKHCLSVLSELDLLSICIDCLYENNDPSPVDDHMFDMCSTILGEIALASQPTSQSSASDPVNVNHPSQSQSQLSDKDKPAFRWQLTPEQQLKLTTAQEELRAIERFRRYGLRKSLAYVRESRRDPAACRDAIVKLTWFASKRASGLSITEWIELMKDLQQLQSHLYRGLISYQECSEIFLSSLLASRSLANIRMANDWLADIYMVDKEGAIGLILKAAHEYFNSSASYADTDMDYAKECLRMAKLLIVKSRLASSSAASLSVASAEPVLVQESERQVKAVLDEILLSDEDKCLVKCVCMIEREEALIASTRYLVELDYMSLLPVQVRSMCSAPLKLVADLLAKKPDIYRQYEKLLRLSAYLHASSRDTPAATATDDIYNQAPVILLIAEHAILKQNMSVLTHMCKHLVRLNYADGWLCAYRLAEDMCTSMIKHLKNEIVSSSVPASSSTLGMQSILSTYLAKQS